jgi:hypothetical protein
MIVDSYDPTVTPYKYDTTKTRGDVTYPGNKRNNGNIATNVKLKTNQDAIRLENVAVYGIAAKGSGLVNLKTNNASVSGEIIDGFYRELKPVQDPSKNAGFSGLTALNTADRPSTKKGYLKTVQITCGKGNGGTNPDSSYYKFTKIHLHKDEIFKVSPFNTSGQQGGIAEVWVTGDIIIHNQGLIQVDNGANVIFYVAGNITLEEKDGNHPAVNNNALKPKVTDPVTGNLVGGNFADPSALAFYGVVVNNKKKHVKIKTDMAGVFYAPDHEFEVNMKSGAPTRQFYGALTGRKFEIKGTSQIHYDESLADVGKPFDYTLETWQEDWYDPAVRTLH